MADEGFRRKISAILSADAETEAKEILKLVPGFSLEEWGRRLALSRRDLAALRKAGLGFTVNPEPRSD